MKRDSIDSFYAKPPDLLFLIILSKYLLFVVFYSYLEEAKEKNRYMGGVHCDDSMISFNNLFNSVVQKKTT